MSQTKPSGHLKWLAILILIALLGAGIGTVAWLARDDDPAEQKRSEERLTKTTEGMEIPLTRP